MVAEPPGGAGGASGPLPEGVPGEQLGGTLPLHGGLVRRSGIALVHAGELVLPAAGSEAEIADAEADERAEVRYEFPVRIEVLGAIDDAEREAIVNDALRRLRHAIESRRTG